MKKILPIAIISIFILAAIPVSFASADPTNGNGNDWSYYDILTRGNTYNDQMPFIEDWVKEYNTMVSLAGSTTAIPAVIKAKWETPDADLTVPYTQILPTPGSSTAVTFFAVVKKGTGDIDAVYSEVYHPDGTYKWEVQLQLVPKVTAINYWTGSTGVATTNVDIVTFNMVYFQMLYGMSGSNYPTTTQMITNIAAELLQPGTDLYMGTASLSYCQPAGWYTVGAIAHDNQYGWCSPLWNHFWYIPFAAFETDFSQLNWGVVQSNVENFITGDWDMDTALQPSARNIGNCPIELYASANDMGFGYDSQWNNNVGRWNIIYDARIGDTVTPVDFRPLPVLDENDQEIISGDSGMKLPGGPIGLCTVEKLEFSLKILKPTQDSGMGKLYLTAMIDPDPFTSHYYAPDMFKHTEPPFIAGHIIPSLVPAGWAQPVPLPVDTDYP